MIDMVVHRHALQGPPRAADRLSDAGRRSGVNPPPRGGGAEGGEESPQGLHPSAGGVDGRLRALGRPRGPGASSTGSARRSRPPTSSGSSASPPCSTASADPQRRACRRCSTSPAPTARARPAPSCAPRSKPPGYRVHVFTSPHLVRFNERIRLAGKLIEDDALAPLARRGARRRRRASSASFFEVDHRRRLPRLRPHPGRRLHPRGRPRRPARRDQRHRPRRWSAASPASASTTRPFSATRSSEIAAEKAGIAKRGVPLVTQPIRPTSPAASARSPTQAGALWLAARRQLGRDRLDAGQLHYRDAQGELDLPLPRLPGDHQALNAALAIAMLRHQSLLAVPTSALARGDGLGATGRRGSSASTTARSSTCSPPAANSGSTAATTPAPRALVADFAANDVARRPAAHPALRQPQVKDAAATLAPFKGIAARHPDPPDPRPRQPRPGRARRDGARAWASRPSPHPDLERRARRDHRARRACSSFGSLYLAGVALDANGSLPD